MPAVHRPLRERAHPVHEDDDLDRPVAVERRRDEDDRVALAAADRRELADPRRALVGDAALGERRLERARRPGLGAIGDDAASGTGGLTARRRRERDDGDPDARRPHGEIQYVIRIVKHISAVELSPQNTVLPVSLTHVHWVSSCAADGPTGDVTAANSWLSNW